MAGNDHTGLAAMLRLLQEEEEREQQELDEEEERDQEMMRRSTGLPSGLPAISGSLDLTVRADTLDAHAVVEDRNQELMLGLGIVNLGGEVAEGEIIEAVTIPWASLARALERDPNLLCRFDPRKVEEIVAAAYHEEGNFDEVVLTPRSGDGGRDVIATKRGRFSIRVLDQVKRYKPGSVVTADEVRAMYGVLTFDRGASKAYVTTTAGFALEYRRSSQLRSRRDWTYETAKRSGNG